MALEKKTELGMTGEKIVRNYMVSKGLIVTDTINAYDSSKDFDIQTPSGKTYTVEVKTQIPYVQKEAFTIKDNQLKKCLSVDVLIFVCVPPNKPFEYGGKIFKVNPKKMQYDEITTKDGRKMISIPINQPAIKPIKDLTSVEILLLSKAKSSNY